MPLDKYVLDDEGGREAQNPKPSEITVSRKGSPDDFGFGAGWREEEAPLSVQTGPFKPRFHSPGW